MASTANTSSEPATETAAPVMRSVQDILRLAEQSKKKGDRFFARNSLTEAIDTYKETIDMLAPLRGTPHGEILAMQALSNMSQCLIKTSQNEKALEITALAISIPSSTYEPHILSKLYHRRGIVFKALGKLPEALVMVDRAISIDGSNLEALETLRTQIIDEIIEKNGIVPVPPKPEILTNQDITNTITTIFHNLANPQEIMNTLGELIAKRAWLDRVDDKKNNILWAICQIAVMKAQQGQNPDDILPFVVTLFQNGCRAEQRFGHLGNKTPMQMFAICGAKECVAATLRFGASSRTSDDDGWTPLMVACSPGRPVKSATGGDVTNAPVVDVLLRARSDINHRNDKGMTALSVACQSGDLEAVKLLLQWGQQDQGTTTATDGTTAANAPVPARLDSRDHLAFSCVVWALIGNTAHSQEVIQEVMRVARTTGPDSLVFQLDQDVRCFNFSKVLHALRSVKDKAKSGTANLPTGTTAEEVLVKTLKAIFHIPDSPSAESGEGESPVEYELMHSFLCGVLPYAAVKNWGPKVPVAPETKGNSKGNTNNKLPTAAEAMTAAVASATQLEKIWLNVLYMALTGPTKELVPPIRTSEEACCYYLCLWDDFRELVQAPLEKTYGRVIPSVGSLKKLREALEASDLVPRLAMISATPANATGTPSSLSGDYWSTYCESIAKVSVDKLELHVKGDHKDGSIIIDDTSIAQSADHESFVLIAARLAESPLFTSSLSLEESKSLARGLVRSLVQRLPWKQLVFVGAKNYASFVDETVTKVAVTFDRIEMLSLEISQEFHRIMSEMTGSTTYSDVNTNNTSDTSNTSNTSSGVQCSYVSTVPNWIWCEQGMFLTRR